MWEHKNISEWGGPQMSPISFLGRNPVDCLTKLCCSTATFDREPYEVPYVQTTIMRHELYGTCFPCAIEDPLSSPIFSYFFSFLTLALLLFYYLSCSLL